MNYRAIEERMNEFFNSVDPIELLREFQDMGYEFVPVDDSNIKEIDLNIDSLVYELKNVEVESYIVSNLPTKNNSSFETLNEDYGYIFAA